MQLKLKDLKWEAGRPVAILHKKTADKNSIHVDDRILIKKNSKSVVAVVDTASEILRENQIILSKEIISPLSLKKNSLINIEPAEKPESIALIHKKMDKQILSGKEIRKIMKDISTNALTESEIAYLISSIYNSKMNMKETANLTKAIVETGQILKFKGKVADKHGVGGVPGRTTPIVVSICACAGLKIPKTSSRAITTPAGTADAMEVLCKVDLPISQVRKIVNKINACLVWGGSLNLAPADDKIIQVERILNLDAEAQMLASIMSKKISVSAKYVIIDIPHGKTAKVNYKQALRLKRKFQILGKQFKMRVKPILFETQEPLGNGIGPALEIIDVIKVLTRESSCYKLEEKSLILASALLELTGKARKGEGLKLAKQILDSKQALKKFEQIIKAQQGSLKIKSKPTFSKNINSKKSGKISFIDIKKINAVARAAGCPIDKFAGIYLHKHLNEKIKKGEKILTIYSESETELASASRLFKKLNPIKIS